MNNAQTTAVKESFIRIVKRGREGVSGKKVIGIRAASIILALIIDAVFIVLVTGLNPISVYIEIFKANRNTNETLFTLMMNYVAIQLVAYTTNILRGQQSALGTILVLVVVSLRRKPKAEASAKNGESAEIKKLEGTF